MPDDENKVSIPAAPDVVEIEVPEPEIIETVTEDQDVWQPTELQAFLVDFRTAMNVLEQNRETLSEQTVLLNLTMQNLTSLLQSVLPGLQVLATLADETTDKNTRRLINRRMRGK